MSTAVKREGKLSCMVRECVLFAFLEGGITNVLEMESLAQGKQVRALLICWLLHLDLKLEARS